MSVFNKISKTVDVIKNFDEEKPIITVESNNHLIIENYNSIRLFTDAQIEIDFENFVIGIKGTNLVMNEFTPAFIKISGMISSIAYTG